MPKTVYVNVEYLTRVEGHGNIVVNVTDGNIEKCNLEIVEAPRLFEGMLRGRSIFEAQHITSRICGICSCGHTLASLQAAEDAIGFKQSAQTEKLRKLLLYQEILDSHILHIYLLAAPDLLGVKSFVPLINSHNDVVRRALRMKKECNNMCEIIAGRHVHPISTTVGGFTKLPKESELDRMRQIMERMQEDMEATVELLTTLTFPSFERDTEYVALVNDENEYPFLEGDVGSTDGVRFDKHEYKNYINEFVVPHSTAKHTKLSRDSYMVGALARYNLNHEKLNSEAKKAALKLKLEPGTKNPYLNTVAQAVESVYCIEESIKIIDELKETGVKHDEKITVGLNENKNIPVKAGRGIGAVEVPRGILFHDYEIDAEGRIINANCMIPTNQNLNNIERDMRKLVPEILEKTEEEITLFLEMLVRAYDPCISCSTHFLNVKFVK